VRLVLARIVMALIVALGVALAAVRFAAIDASSHSASDTLRPWLVQAAAIAILAAVSIALIDRWSGRASRP
jgi:membrane protein implicated in regulation of membrane protease activity